MSSYFSELVKKQTQTPNAMPRLFIVFAAFSLFLSSSHSALLSPIKKDHSTRQYTLTVYLKTPLQPTKLLLDLGASFSWVDCTQNYTSTTYHYIPCYTPLCDSLHSLACSNCFDPPGPGCANNSCSLFPENSVTRQTIIAEALVDSLALPTTDGRNPGRLALVPDFVFSCSKTSLLKGLAKGVSGLAGLGRSNISLPAQAVQFNNTLLTIDENGIGGTKISTVNPYTVLETSIYKAFTEAFVSESAALNLTTTNRGQAIQCVLPSC
ncbi:hypothetical protein F0562_002570 [Nyssa sinensis]|uniref:Xylanase inhibitor N-terminal domain-containing protein n=1 Tax=Nyssa sinensis TaxID=561372 RepID=A0A5J5C7B0_9ASTE|nr:hypothetical protein F0562_002570 [Nyssa sinensis]